MSFSEAHPRDTHGRFAPAGAFSVADGTIYADGWKLTDCEILSTTTSMPRVDVREVLPRRPSWRQPSRLWRWWIDRRRGVAWRNKQQTRSGTFKVTWVDELWARRMYQFLGLEPPPLASWPVRAIARALTWGIVARMMRGG